jgi:hypothetical protein
MTTTKLFASLLVVFSVACAQNKPVSAPTAQPSPASVEAEPPQTQLEEQDRARTGLQDVLLEGGLPGPR